MINIVFSFVNLTLLEGNMARVASEVVGMQLKLIPIVGETLASYAEPIAEKTTGVFLETLCAVMNCCFN